eukprot:CAMPEP_0118956834 /NCGR_PEP_ID=MMETSP1169-20130426/61787_1 /TAXON_ID=36882 /ORGANISM="Pyramimonas obovata, Strain CCMP722" /LENGTH=303 /DNA_ID=CAMNT_0006904881 /DNA_START=173 /DNA_END=1084 /DNA_ORIENTATION=+
MSTHACASQCVGRGCGGPRVRAVCAVRCKYSGANIGAASLTQRAVLKGEGVSIKARGVTLPVASRCVAEARPDLAVPESKDWFAANQDMLRTVPLWVGGLGGTALLMNRALSGIAAVSDASSSQSRADVLCLAMAASLLLTGLSWLSLRSREPAFVTLSGEDVFYINPDLEEPAASELKWCWEAVKAASRCGSLVVLHDGKRLLQAGTAPTDIDLTSAPALGVICDSVMSSGKGNYLANMALFPGRVEFEPVLPYNTKAVLVQPIGSKGVLIAASGTVRGFSRLDQAWLAAMSDKLEVTLEDE